MKISYTTKNGRITAEFEGEGHSNIWKQLSAFQTVFEEDVCGKCQSSDLQCSIRKAYDAKKKEFLYHELRCNKCGAKLEFGVLDDGTSNLFPKRKDNEGNWRGTFGWTKFNKQTQQEE